MPPVFAVSRQFTDQPNPQTIPTVSTPHDRPIASQAAIQYLRLWLCPGVGAIRFANLLRELGSIEAIMDAGESLLARVEGVGPKTARAIVEARPATGDRVKRELDLAARSNARLICIADDEYPAILKRIDDPPPCLFIRGTLEPADAVAVAVVGSRQCSRYGAEQSERFGALLAGAGMTVVSGMARGIDSAAHRGALKAGGRTLAILGCGLCHVYPAEAEHLARDIAAHGAVISELPMDTAPDASNFPPRNRIIVGLSLGTLVIEAAHKSGAMISARLASEYNREVFALPGPVDRPQSEGCHELIKTGAAKLITGLPDILEELGEVGRILSEPGGANAGTNSADPLFPTENADPKTPAPSSLSNDERTVLESMGRDAYSIDELCERVTLPPARIAAAITTLQLKGILRRADGDQYERSNRA